MPQVHVIWCIVRFVRFGVIELGSAVDDDIVGVRCSIERLRVSNVL